MGGYKKTVTVWILVAAIVVVAASGYILVRGRNSESNTPATAANQVGQTIETGGIQFTVLRSYDSKGTDSERPTHRNIFTIARISVTNKTDQLFSVKPEDLILMVDGKEIPLIPLSYVFDRLVMTALQPGDTVEGALSWETPQRCRNKNLVYHAPSGESIAVDLLKKAE